MPEQPTTDAAMLPYATPSARAPGLLAAALWLNYIAAGSAILLLGLALYAATALQQRAGRPPEWKMIAVTCFYGTLFLASALFCASSIRSRRRRKATRGLSLVLALFIPFGTLAGLFTYVALGRPAVLPAYDGGTRS